ncbi:hypothetical protein [[Phormidium] sp. ETS-05]|uniref:hypothetical protein n=1 Tax=[Phormidium] sp. ETS-05 TaxID=222819 RepID=UPI0018EEF7E3|nr:hypothetical protein [[Phormidium] sp. ETS-05]
MDVGDARRVLERVRTYLVSLQHEDRPISSVSGTKTNSQVLSSPTDPADALGELESARGVWRGAIEQEIGLLRAGLMQPLLSEIAALRQERETLAQEIRELEINRHHQYSLAQQQSAQQQLLADWLQGLMSRLQESLKEQVARSLMQLESNLLTYESGSSPKQLNVPYQASSLSQEKVPPESAHPLLDPQTRLEHLRMLQSESDGLLISLDATLRAVFESIERNLHAYEQSMSESVDKMYRLGQQGEVIFARLVGQMSQGELLMADPVLDTDAQNRATEAELAATGSESGKFIGTVSTPESPVFSPAPTPLEVGSEVVREAEALLFSSPPALSAPTAEPNSVEFPFAGTEFVEETARSQPPITDLFGDGVVEIVESDLSEVAPEDTDQLLNADVMAGSALVDEARAVDVAARSEAAPPATVTDMDDRLVVTEATPSVVSIPQSRPKAVEIEVDMYESLLLAAGAAPPSMVSGPASVDESEDVFGEITTPEETAPLASDVVQGEEDLMGGMADRSAGEGWDWDFAPPKERAMAEAPVVEEVQSEAVSQAASLEAFLFGDGDGDDRDRSPASANTTDALSLDSALPPQEPNVTSVPESQTGSVDGTAATSALNDLFGDLGALETDSETNQLEREENVAYLAALPEEDLLADGSANPWGDRSPKAGSDSQLWLNTSALQQLSEDLSSLETASEAEATAARNNSEAMLDDMLDQWTSEPPDANVPSKATSTDDMFGWPENSGAASGTDAPATSALKMEIGMVNENPLKAADKSEVEPAPTAAPPSAYPSGVLAEAKPDQVTVDDIFADLMAASSTPEGATQSNGNPIADVVPESKPDDSSLDDFFDGFTSSGQMRSDHQMSPGSRGDKSMSDWLPEPEASASGDLSDFTLDDFFASLSEDKPTR